jgi:hypothetical protein
MTYVRSVELDHPGLRSPTITVIFSDATFAGQTLKIEDHEGSIWYGGVADDGVALLTLSSLLPVPKMKI